MEEQRFYSGILFVIVVYEKALEHVSSIKKITEFYGLRDLTPAIFVHDNSKVAQSARGLVCYKHDAANSGVSHAYNVAADFAVEKGKNWMCLLDQDIEVDEHVLSAYFKSVSQFQNEHLFVPRIISSEKIISPYKKFFGKGYSIKSISTGRLRLKNFEAINSGLLIDVETFKKAGGYDENYPLDLSDYVFWKRLSRVTTSFVVTAAVCEQHHSASVNQPEQAIHRFKIFLKANKQYRRDTRSIVTFIPVLSRGVRLSWRFRSTLFVKLALKSFTQPM